MLKKNISYKLKLYKIMKFNIRIRTILLLLKQHSYLGIRDNTGRGGHLGHAVTN